VNLHGPVRASEAAGPGTAQVTISFAAWKEGNVGPTKHTVQAVAAIPAPKLEPISSRFVKTLTHPDRKANVTDVRFFAKGTKLFAAGYPSGVVQVFDPTTGKELCRIESPPGYRSSADYAVPTSDLQTLYVAVSRRKAATSEKDGKRQTRIEYNGELLAWDMATPRPMPSIQPSASERGVMRAYLSPNGDKIVTVERLSHRADEGVADETLLWDVRTKTAKSLGKAHGTAAFSRDGRRLALAFFATQTEPGRLLVMDLETNRELFTIKETAKGGGFFYPVLSPDNKTLAVQLNAGRAKPPAIRLYDIESGKELAAFESSGGAPFTEAVFSADGHHLAAADYGGGVTVWDIIAKKTVGQVAIPKGMRAGTHVAFSADGKLFAAVAALATPTMFTKEPDPSDLPQPRALVFDLTRRAEPEILICPSGYCGGLAFSPDGNTLAVGGAGGVHLFELSRK
jgi:WD40 repeat protein